MATNDIIALGFGCFGFFCGLVAMLPFYIGWSGYDN